MNQFDPDRLREKYRRERDKRIRTDGNRQYVELAGDFANLLEDPYTPRTEREPLNDDVDVLIVGGGFSGLITAARLREAAIGNIRIIEKGGDFGGTWYWNRYPGAACDVESYIYLPLLEEMDVMPRRKYATAQEILDYSREVASKYDLYANACLQTEVTEVSWSEEDLRWSISTDRNDRINARFVILANGPAHKPKLPGIPGLGRFTGEAFHTTRWNYSITGGGPEGNLTKLSDKRVGIIGTGATAVQCIPHLGASAEHLYVFQRTPSSVDVRNDHDTDPAWWRTLAPGWQKARRRNFDAILSGKPFDTDLIQDGWTDGMSLPPEMADAANMGDAEVAELADLMKMEKVRQRVDDVVIDPATAEALKPYYRRFCKRPCFHDEYLKTFNRSNVSLIDTQGRGVEEITERGVVVAGKEYELDCLVFATGFEIGTNYIRRAGYDVAGVDGLRLSQKWRAGVTTLHGMHSVGFPNLFFLMGEQTGFTLNYTHLVDEQAQHIAYIMRQVAESDFQRIEATPDAEAAWADEIVVQSQSKIDFLKDCTPGYYNGEGQIDSDRAKRSQALEASVFFDLLLAWRKAGGMTGLACA